MKWLNLSEFGLHLGFRKATSFREKVAVLSVKDLNVLSRFITFDELNTKLKEIGFERVNSEDGKARFVKADNSINPKQFTTFLPITNKHIQDMPESEARAQFLVDKQAWIDVAAKLSLTGKVWKLDKTYFKAAGISWNENLAKNYLDLSLTQDDRYVSLAFESPLPVSLLETYKYDSAMLGVMTTDKEILKSKGIPEEAFQEVAVNYMLPLLPLNNELHLVINDIREVPEILEYHPDTWRQSLNSFDSSVTRSAILNKINNYAEENVLNENISELLHEIGKYYEHYNECLLDKNKTDFQDERIEFAQDILKNEILKLDKYGVVGEKSLTGLSIISDISQDKDESVNDSKNESKERIEDYGEYVFGARKHFYQKSQNEFIEEFESSKGLPLDVLIDKYQKRNLWSFKNETMANIGENNAIFFIAQSVYNMIPAKISFSKNERKDPDECHEKIKSYMYSVNHFKEMVHTAIDLDKSERMPLATFVNQMVNYRNVLRGYAQDPQQFLFDELDENRILAMEINNVVRGSKLRGSPLSQVMESFETLKIQFSKMMFIEAFPVTKEVSYPEFQDYVESGGHPYQGSALNQFVEEAEGKLGYAYISRQFEQLENKLGQELFFEMMTTGNKPFADALIKNVEKILENDKNLKTPLDLQEGESKTNYLLTLYRYKYDAKYTVPSAYLKDEVDNNQTLDNLKITDKFDQQLKKILKDQEPNRLDLRYPSIVAGLAHETSKNFRKGENVNPEQFSKIFGFRAIQFGNWVTQQERQHLLNISFDGLSELRDALELESNDISLNGTLAIAFGARGQSGRNASSAHYEFVDKIFNLTKQNGAGSLAHEWFHGLDAYMAEVVKKDTAKLVYKSGNFESVKDNYFLSHLMADVDYRTSKVIIEGNPLLKSVYELQLKLNGKMQQDEIFSEVGKNLIINRIDELVESNLDRVKLLTNSISKTLESQGMERISTFIDDISTQHIEAVKKYKDVNLVKDITYYLINDDLHLNRKEMYRAFKAMYKELLDNNAPVGKYTLANPITGEYNRLYRLKDDDSAQIKSEKEILAHLRTHKHINEIERLFHESMFYQVQRQSLPLFINQVNSIGGQKPIILKQVALDQYQSYMEKSFQAGKSVQNKLDLDLVFNNNNFASQSKILDRGRKTYFSEVCERFARSGEALVTDLLAEKNVQVDYLVSDMQDPQTNGRRSGVSPSGNDRTEILNAFKRVIEACREYAFNHEQDLESELDHQSSNNLSFGAN